MSPTYYRAGRVPLRPSAPEAPLGRGGPRSNPFSVRLGGGLP
jgi:hypothetical protein